VLPADGNGGGVSEGVSPVSARDQTAERREPAQQEGASGTAGSKVVDKPSGGHTHGQGGQPNALDAVQEKNQGEGPCGLPSKCVVL